MALKVHFYIVNFDHPDVTAFHSFKLKAVKTFFMSSQQVILHQIGRAIFVFPTKLKGFLDRKHGIPLQTPLVS